MNRSFLPALVGLLLVAFVATMASAQVRVRGYYRKDGTYVRPHHRSSPDGNFSNNWSTYGNRNPFTGEIGTKRYPSSSGGGEVFGPSAFAQSSQRSKPARPTPNARGNFGDSAASRLSSGGNSVDDFDTAGNKTGSNSAPLTSLADPSTDDYWREIIPSDEELRQRALQQDRIEIENYREAYRKSAEFLVSTRGELEALGVDTAGLHRDGVMLTRLKYRIAEIIRAFGYEIDWQGYSVSELSLIAAELQGRIRPEEGFASQHGGIRAYLNLHSAASIAAR